jgi:2-polyprenyl-6-hydroxyphenyl methylase / 3-demethylubiquinone-9 3-methyltransferase
MSSPSQGQAEAASASVDDDEIARFQAIAAEWWDPTGKFRPLHKIGPARLAFIRNELDQHFDIPADRLKAFDGLSILDVGCGGGLISEALARLGAQVTGIDPGERNVAIAKQHAEGQDLKIDYRATTAEALVKTGDRFDAIACLEVVEHVNDVGAFVATLAELLKPGGILILSTINRNVKSYALAIVAAEYVLRWLPRGTHQWEKFITPDELSRDAAAAGLETVTTTGMTYNPLRDEWSLNPRDTDVNYLMSARSVTTGTASS